MVFIAFLGLFFLFVDAQILKDKITSLPGYTGPLGNQYSGYISLGGSVGRKFHYWFIESQGNPSTDPVVLWLNGGPGCSSMDGLFYEHGPFKFAQTKNVQLVPNPWSWNRVANMLYLESPDRVGFSYADHPTDEWNDPQTADNNYQFLQNWFKSYPKYLKNDFYISGESYGGVYVPFLARNVLNGILDGSFVIPFKGILVGNGVSNAAGETDLNVNIPFLYGHGLLSTKFHSALQQACASDPNSDDCQNYIGDAYNFASGINMYGIYYDCYSQRPVEYLPNQSLLKKVARPLSTVPCIDSTHANTYLNTLAVKQAIHVNTSITWSICSDYVNGNYDRTSDSVVPIHKFLLSHGIRALIYSGDTDFAVPYTDSEYWTSNAGLTESNPWHQWFYTDVAGDQVAGMATTYSEGLTFVTVRGPGHMVPQFAPNRAYEMFHRFLKNTPF